jgi:hypothetical protein
VLVTRAKAIQDEDEILCDVDSGEEFAIPTEQVSVRDVGDDV